MCVENSRGIQRNPIPNEVLLDTQTGKVGREFHKMQELNMQNCKNVFYTRTNERKVHCYCRLRREKRCDAGFYVKKQGKKSNLTDYKMRKKYVNWTKYV